MVLCQTKILKQLLIVIVTVILASRRVFSLEIFLHSSFLKDELSVKVCWSVIVTYGKRNRQRERQRVK